MNKFSSTILVLAFLFPIITYGQGWEETYDLGFSETTGSVQKTEEGGLIILGRQTGTSDETERPFLYQIDSLGSPIWEFYDEIHKDSSVSISDLIITNDGNYLMSINHGSSLMSMTRVLQKVTPDGDLLWEKIWSDKFTGGIRDIEETATGDIVVLGLGGNAINDSTGVAKLDQVGNIIWDSHQFLTANTAGDPQDIVITANGDIIVVAKKLFNTYVHRLNGSDGSVVWQKLYEETTANYQASPLGAVELSTGEIVVGISIEELGQFKFIPTLLKIDGDGNEIWKKSILLEQSNFLTSFAKTNDGEFVLTGVGDNAWLSTNDLFLAKVDANGNLQWNRNYGVSEIGEFVRAVIPADDQGYYLVGEKNNADLYVVKTDSLGYSFTNQFIGKIYNDENIDCSLNADEKGLSQWYIKAKRDGDTYLAVTDSQGNFEFLIDTGIYNITAYPKTPYWEICNNNFTIDFTTTFDTLTADIGAQAIIDCPLLDVSIGTPFLRKCFENTYTVSYCNYGTIPAEDAYVEIDFDPAMSIVESSIPITAQVGNLVTFEIDDVPVDDCNSFTVKILLGDPANCDSIPLGATHCVEAHIYPDSICLPSGNWSGASVELDAICTGDSISFIISNVGTAATQPNLVYVVVEDNVVLFDGSFGLDPNENEVITVATNGSTFRMEAEQEPNHPGMSMPSVSVENCGDPNSIFSFGFINIFSQDDGDPFVDVDCQQNVASYDPNDKQGFPLGYGAENYINRGQEIDYMIRFQNTGTDTAFNIVIEDKLSELLDITSVRPGAASHPYQFSISQDRTMSFEFNNIMLPDSNVNLVASNGFVKFKVSQIPDLEIGTQIQNSASIFFDFNAPIITNQTLHTIGENNIMVSIDPIEKQEADVKIYPNPFSVETKIELEGVEIDKGIFKVYDATGRLIRTQNFNNNQFIFSKKDLKTGMYFFTIENNNQIISSGKLVAQQQ